ncbi:hypothetical protein [Paenibacillus harenae]|uniref:DUF2313 domain-containing protein n=1 Tax=Paenibacillus harenae TaxID=306543 RepID=A0ABT9U8U6_PAEHA|nr:hypothetical protein [Paenibacillus harenae]MDQ0114624.1 hypothetical protein [Paenibacillus harenae]
MYPIIKAPFEIIPLEIMTKRETDDYFQWFISQVPSRIEILSTYYERTSKERKSSLNLSQDSLITLWEWFVPNIQRITKTTEEIQEEMSNAPEWLKEEIENDTLKFSDETETMIIDIGIYFGAVILKSYSNLNWGVIRKPRNYVDVNQPVIVGFKHGALNPIRVVTNCALQTIDEQLNNKKLYEVYNIWSKYL